MVLYDTNVTINDLFDDQIDDSFDERENVLFEVITPNSYIALNAFSHFEQFCVCKVLSLEIADRNGHAVRKGDRYFICNYLKKNKGEIESVISYKIWKYMYCPNKFSRHLLLLRRRIME